MNCKLNISLTSYRANILLTAAESQTSSDASGDKVSSVASSNVATPAPAAAAVAEAALSEFSPQLTSKILELLCDESVCQSATYLLTDLSISHVMLI